MPITRFDADDLYSAVRLGAELGSRDDCIATMHSGPVILSVLSREAVIFLPVESPPRVVRMEIAHAELDSLRREVECIAGRMEHHGADDTAVLDVRYLAPSQPSHPALVQEAEGSPYLAVVPVRLLANIWVVATCGLQALSVLARPLGAAGEWK